MPFLVRSEDDFTFFLKTFVQYIIPFKVKGDLNSEVSTFK